MTSTSKTEISDTSMRLSVAWKDAYHPFLFALYPILFLLAQNVGQIRYSEAYRSLVIVLICTACGVGLLRWVSGNWLRAAVLCSLGIMLFFSYGHVYAALEDVSLAGVQLGRHRFLIPIWLAVWAVGWGISRRGKLHNANQILNVVSLVMLLWPVYTLVSHRLTPSILSAAPSNVSTASHSELSLEAAEELPDIYYIILDAYARADYLKQRYDYDNEAFRDFLADRGFYLAEESQANYLWTVLSLVSATNMDYFDALGIDPVTCLRYPYDCAPELHHSVVRRELEGLGYSTVAFSSGWLVTEIEDASYFLRPATGTIEDLRVGGVLNRFEGMLLHTSAGLILTDLISLRSYWVESRLEYPYRVQREIILSTFEDLPKAASLPGPKFVFAHIISPHKPYLFDAQGNEPQHAGAFTFVEGSESELLEEGAHLYRGQVIYITSQLQTTIDAILSQSEQPPVIIIQSDHGPGLGLDWNDPDEMALGDRMGILNAYLLPERCQANLYPSITPVNSFRVVFNCVLGGSFEMLEDVTYIKRIKGHKSFDFVPMTEQQP